ncbi:hypothetical protein MPTK1_6g14110 [Marchantia polymorpha subsp. ruderalis]|uniref:Uncharacterized protein n=2 Tax=Marchantia polymorpha TaxID=3197 RepID=A0AAF6BRV8_MARPO|nr:hypothetical protein MARPO_0047s0065 [Marchantia polymorpha]BBN14742.1 hypothetical protein Mp_6g14110 [Marchantia polymorpha subsp. ruderalis]|eukprot:PTQ39085.1 hypothetical protein MARPO_0047s0065 [Marchantia polymorpha]
MRLASQQLFNAVLIERHEDGFSSQIRVHKSGCEIRPESIFDIMSGGREGRYIHSEPVSDTTIGSDAQSDSWVPSIKTEVTESLNIHGGQTVKVSTYQKSGEVQILISYTIIEYDKTETAMSRNVFDSSGRLIRR